MPTWDADQYLKFEAERTRPCRDLADRVAVASPRRIIDLGCGPGNSTAVIAQRWPDARIHGLDNSPEMIQSARGKFPGREWIVGDIATWAVSNVSPFDVVFSNAAMQWVNDHGAVYPRLMRQVSPSGALAAQVPGNFDAPAHRIMREIASSPKWESRFPAGGPREWHVHDLAFYYDVLSPLAERLDLWETEYLHVLPSAQGIVDWYKGTGMRPFLDALASEEQRSEFAAEYLNEIRAAYPPRSDGRVLFPFRRLFVVAYQKS
jgi:trans-aconitate 2-methyltransferase